MLIQKLNDLSRYKDYAPIFLRLIFLLYLVSALRAKVFLPSVISDFSEQLVKLNFPVPLFMAYLGTWTALIGYIMIILGWKTRLAAIPIIIYFAVAILTYHLPEGHGLRQTMPATVLLVMGCFLLINGPGKPSFDEGK